MKPGVEYRDIAKKIVAILSEYDVKYNELERILGWMGDEIQIRPVQHSSD